MESFLNEWHPTITSTGPPASFCSASAQWDPSQPESPSRANPDIAGGVTVVAAFTRHRAWLQDNSFHGIRLVGVVFVSPCLLPPRPYLNSDIVSTSLRDICLADPTRAQETHVGLRNLTSRLEAEMLGIAVLCFTQNRYRYCQPGDDIGLAVSASALS